jgi:ATP-binding cassette, sub-family E, member 1
MPPKKKGQSRKAKGDETLQRIAIINAEKCKPKKCKQECKKYCPVVRMGKVCIEVMPTSKIAWVSEELCIGCGICVKKCPFGAVNIINLPKNLQAETTHRYGPNSFKLHRLPTPRPGQVLGLVGTNGIGKSTALKILAGKVKPNLGRHDNPPDWQEILKYFRGSELQNYFTRLLEDNIRAIVKPQWVDHIPRAVKGQVGKILRSKDQRGCIEKVMKYLDLVHLDTREVAYLSGGELQRFAIAIIAVQDADMYMFDEPTSYLDVKQRLQAGAVIRELLGENWDDADANADKKSTTTSKYVIVVEHDLAVLDYLSDYICCLYGQAGAYGVVTMPFSVRDGINIFLAGFIPTENLRFRDSGLSFKVQSATDSSRAIEAAGNKGKKLAVGATKYPNMTKTMASKKKSSKFVLHVKAGDFNESEIIVLLGENGCGKTTFIRMLAGIHKADGVKEEDAASKAKGVPPLHISYKPQKIQPKFRGTVRELLQNKINKALAHTQFQADVVKPMKIEPIIDNEVKTLSGGELQRVAITLALGTPAQVYLIDEPSAYLDSEQRITAAKVIKKYIINAKKTAFIVEHDFIMATYLADRVVVYTGQPGVECTAGSPTSLLLGMNQFLKQLDVTFRRDPTNFRPRINKANSQKDKEQKATGAYFFLDSEA